MSGPGDNGERADHYVLGLLEGEELARFEAALATDPALQAAVAASRERFLDLDRTARPVAVDGAMWERIAARLDGAPETEHPATMGPGTGTARATPPAAANQNRPAAWRNLSFAALAASLLLSAGLVWTLLSEPQVRIVAVLIDAGGAPLAVVEDYGGDAAKVTLLAEFDVPEGKTMQVWTLPSPEIGPVSLGLLERSSTAVLEAAGLPAPHEDQLYEITVEQAGGSPTGRPTGPILVKGFGKAPR